MTPQQASDLLRQIAREWPALITWDHATAAAWANTLRNLDPVDAARALDWHRANVAGVPPRCAELLHAHRQLTRTPDTTQAPWRPDPWPDAALTREQRRERAAPHVAAARAAIKNGRNRQ